MAAADHAYVCVGPQASRFANCGLAHHAVTDQAAKDEQKLLRGRRCADDLRRAAYATAEPCSPFPQTVLTFEKQIYGHDLYGGCAITSKK
jgi:hypothetical protein